MLKVRIKKEASASVVSGRKSKPKMAAVKIFKEVEKTRQQQKNITDTTI